MQIKRTAFVLMAAFGAGILISGCSASPGGELAAAPQQKKEFFIGQPAKQNTRDLAKAETEEITNAAQSNGKTVLDPEYSDVLSSQAYNLLNSGKHQDAALMFEQALAMNPNNIVAEKGLKKVNDLLGKKTETQGEKTTKADAQRLVQLETGMTDKAAYYLDNSATPEPEDASCVVEPIKGEIEKDAFADISLYWPLPVQFRKNEVFVISGKVTGDKSDEAVTASIGGGKEKQITEVMPKDGSFSLPLYFTDTGEYLLSMAVGDVARTRAVKITVTDPGCEPLVNAKSSLPGDLDYSIDDGQAVFAWNDKGNNLFRLEFLQRQNKVVFYVYNEKRLTPPLPAFRGFTEGAAKLKIWGAKADQNSLDRLTAWMPGQEMELFLTQHISRDRQPIASIDATENFVVGDRIDIRGESELQLDPKMWVSNRKGDFSSTLLSMIDKKFHGSFLPERLGTHVIGIYENTGLPAFIAGIVPKGSVPLVPDYFDLETPTPRIDPRRISENLFRYINHERNNSHGRLLVNDPNLEKLAQARADDACKRDYLAETDPDGRTAADLKDRFEVKGEIAVNLIEANDIRSAHEAIMRSPKGQANVIDPDMGRIGIGYCQRDPREKRYVIIEIFEKVSSAKPTPTAAPPSPSPEV